MVLNHVGVSTEDNQLVDDTGTARSAWGAGSWSLGGLAQQPRELPPRAGPASLRAAGDAQAEAGPLPKPWAARIGEWGLGVVSGGDAAGSDEQVASLAAVPRAEGAADADAVWMMGGEALAASGGGGSGHIAASVLAAVMPTAAMLAAEPGVASVGVHVSVSQGFSVTPPQPGDAAHPSRVWHVAASADVAIADAGATAAMAEAMTWQTAAATGPNVLDSHLLPRSPSDDGSLLGETASERALGLIVLAMLWVFMVSASPGGCSVSARRTSQPAAARADAVAFSPRRACSSAATCIPKRTRRTTSVSTTAAASRLLWGAAPVPRRQRQRRPRSPELPLLPRAMKAAL